MPDTVFWDTAAFVALGNRDDELHPEAVSVSQALADGRAFILTTDAVLTEVVNTFSKAAWHPVAQQLVESLRASVTL